MRSCGVAAERPRRARRRWLLLLLAAATVLALAPAAASAAPQMPPPGVDKWPTPDVCAQSGFIVNTEHREYCEYKKHCDSLRGDDSDYVYWQPWCSVRWEGINLQGCLPGSQTPKFCAENRRKLAQRCARAGSNSSGPESWLCDEYRAVYRVTPPPASPPPATPPPSDEAPAPEEDGGGTGTDEEDDGEEGQEKEEEPAPDVFAALGARSPMCNRPSELTPAARERCKTAGSIVHGYPLSHYGLDVHASEDSGSKLMDLEVHAVVANGVASAFQHVLGLFWMLQLLIVKGVLLLLEWAFEIPLIASCRDTANAGACDNAMPQVSAGLRHLHEDVLGRGWLAVAFAAAGAWGIWNGMVRRRIAETAGGLLATVALMIAGILIVYNPFGTVGEVARISNDATLDILHASSVFERDESEKGYAGAQAALFDTLVKQPWCALQFGDVEYCLRDRGKGRATIADVWLSFDSGTVHREALFKLTKGEDVDNGWGAKAGDALKAFGHDVLFGFGDAAEDDPDPWGDRDRAKEAQDKLKEVVGGGKTPEKVHLQQAGGTPQRFAVYALVTIEQAAAMLVLLWLGVRLIGTAVWSLILLLISPAVLLCAGFGPPGRRVCLTFALRLLAALLARFLLAFALTIVLTVDGVLAGLDIGWFPAALLGIAYWAGLFMQRERLNAFARFDADTATSDRISPAAAGLSAMGMLYGYQTLRYVGGDISQMFSRPAGSLIDRGRDLRDSVAAATVREGAGDRLREKARKALLQRRAADRARAQDQTIRATGLRDRLALATGQRQDAERRLHALDPRARLADLERRRNEMTAQQAARRQDMSSGLRAIRRLDEQRAELTKRRDAALGKGESRFLRAQEAQRGTLERRRQELARTEAAAQHEVREAARLRPQFEQGRQAALDGGHAQLASAYEGKLADLESRERRAHDTLASAGPELAETTAEIGRIDRSVQAFQQDRPISKVDRLNDKIAEVEADREQERVAWESARTEYESGEAALAANAVEIEQARADVAGSPDLDARADVAAAKSAFEAARDDEQRIAAELGSPEIEWAEQVMDEDEDWSDPSDADVDRWIDERRAAVLEDADPVAGPQLEAIGRTEKEYAAASPAEQETMRRESLAAMAEHRRIFQLDAGEELSRGDARAAVEDARRHDPAGFARDYLRNAEEAREERRRERDLRRRER